MNKKVWVGLILCALFVPGCLASLDPFPSSEIRSGHHISAMAVYEGDIYFGAGYCLYRLNTQRRQLDELACTDNWTFGRPVVDGDQVYAHVVTLPDEEQLAVAIDLSVGMSAWQVKEKPRGLAAGLRDGTTLVDDQLAVALEGRIHTLDTQSGRARRCTKWNHRSGPIPFFVYDDLIWYAVDEYDSRPKDATVVALEPGTCKTLLTVDLRPDTRFDVLLHVNDEWIIGLDYGEQVDQLFAVRRSQPNSMVWTTEIALNRGISDVVLHEKLVIVRTPEAVYALDLDSGDTEWTVEPGTRESRVQETETVLPVDLDDQLYALDPASGAVIWKYAPPDPNPLRYIASGNTVYVAYTDTIDVLDLHTGKVLWQVRVDSEYEFLYAPF